MLASLVYARRLPVCTEVCNLRQSGRLRVIRLNLSMQRWMQPPAVAQPEYLLLGGFWVTFVIV